MKKLLFIITALVLWHPTFAASLQNEKLSTFVVTHQVKNFKQWFTVFNNYEPKDAKYKFNYLKVLRSSTSPNTVLIIGQGKERSVKAFINSTEMKDVMNRAGVITTTTFIGNEVGL